MSTEQSPAPSGGANSNSSVLLDRGSWRLFRPKRRLFGGLDPPYGFALLRRIQLREAIVQPAVQLPNSLF
jgi:hypothetical protein